jgi:hypothetical protein
MRQISTNYYVNFSRENFWFHRTFVSSKSWKCSFHDSLTRTFQWRVYVNWVSTAILRINLSQCARLLLKIGYWYLTQYTGGLLHFHYHGSHWLFISVSRAAEEINNVVDSNWKCIFLNVKSITYIRLETSDSHLRPSLTLWSWSLSV